ncbi:hypothetical protein [Streptomyces sp. NPDC007063]|uniref:hypothetical protein n=1 Tax=Streptomyces sp. NPDC007063 TaxID=3364772 RepID=UPI0036CE74BA
MTGAPTPGTDALAQMLGPRTVGGIYYGGPWAGTYRLVGIHLGDAAHAALGTTAPPAAAWQPTPWAVTVLSEDDHQGPRTHCTPWQYERDVWVGPHAVAEPPTRGVAYRPAYSGDDPLAPAPAAYSSLAPARQHIEHLLATEGVTCPVVWMPDELTDPLSPLEAHTLGRHRNTVPTGYYVEPLLIRDEFTPQS